MGGQVADEGATCLKKPALNWLTLMLLGNDRLVDLLLTIDIPPSPSDPTPSRFTPTSSTTPLKSSRMLVHASQ